MESTVPGRVSRLAPAHARRGWSGWGSRLEAFALLAALFGGACNLGGLGQPAPPDLTVAFDPVDAHAADDLPGPDAAEPTCSDGARNQDETDADCGGALCGPCANGKGCAADRDCTSRFCDGHLCARRPITFTGSLEIAVPGAGSGFGLATADFDGDGLLDVVLGTPGSSPKWNETTPQAALLRGRGRGRFDRVRTTAASTSPASIAKRTTPAWSSRAAGRASSTRRARSSASAARRPGPSSPATSTVTARSTSSSGTRTRPWASFAATATGPSARSTSATSPTRWRAPPTDRRRRLRR